MKPAEPVTDAEIAAMLLRLGTESDGAFATCNECRHCVSGERVQHQRGCRLVAAVKRLRTVPEVKIKGK